MKIDKYQKIKDNIYRIFLSNGEVLDLYEDVIIDNNLLYKKEIDNDLINKLNNENNYQIAYYQAIKYITVRLRSINEIKIYLEKKKVSSDIIEMTIDKLIKNNYLNDDVFTKAFIKDKLNFTSMGKYRLIKELNNLKVSSDIINDNIAKIDEDTWNQRMDKLINKYIASKKKYTGNTLKNKLYTYLVNLGYDKSLVISKLNEYDF